MIFPTTFFYIPRAEATQANRLFSKEPQTFKPPVLTSMLFPCSYLSLECSSLILYPLITYQSELKSNAITSVSVFLTCQTEGTAFFFPHSLLSLSGIDCCLPCMLILACFGIFLNVCLFCL